MSMLAVEGIEPFYLSHLARKTCVYQNFDLVPPCGEKISILKVNPLISHVLKSPKNGIYTPYHDLNNIFV